MNKSHKKYRLGIRLQTFNRLTIPVLLNQLELSDLEAQLDIKIIQNANLLRRFISDKRPGLLLYSFMTPNLPSISKEIEWVCKKKNDNLKLFAGGPHCNGDYAVTGAAEMGFMPFLESYLENGFHDVPTILYLPELDNLDKSLPLSKLMATSPPLEITRGCHWNCKFCQTACQKTIHRSPS